MSAHDVAERIRAARPASPEDRARVLAALAETPPADPRDASRWLSSDAFWALVARHPEAPR